MAVEEPLSGSTQNKSLSSPARLVGIKELVDNGIDAVPALYIRPPSERPTEDHAAHPQHRIPTISLAALASDSLSGNGAARKQVLQEIRRACEQWGFFQVIDHGVETSVIEGLQVAGRRFFDQPAVERMRFHSQVHDVPVAYLTSFNPSMEKVREWKDGLGFNRFPGRDNGFLHAPDICKKEVQEYIAQVDSLARMLYKAIFESLGMQAEHLEEEVPCICRTRLVINYYPPCPDPSLTLGLSSHSDVSSLTILHPDAVPGLEIKHQDMWVQVLPIDPSAFIVNLGDQIEILTNGRYKSVEHRACTNARKPRMSIACFFGPDEEAIVAPLPITVDDNHPLCYKPTKFKDYYQNFLLNKLLPNRGTLDFARVQ